MNKFLDEDNIIKQPSNEMEIEFEENEEEEETDVEEPLLQQSPSTQMNTIAYMSPRKFDIVPKTPLQDKLIFEKTIVANKEDEIKSDKEIQIELMNKYKLQLLSKTVDLEFAHKSYKDAMNTSERERAEMTYENLSKDIKTLKQKINILGDIIGRRNDT